MTNGVLRETALVIMAGLLATTVLTHPLVLRMDRVGRMNTGDGQVSIWNVAWVAHALATDPARVFQANIYYPHPDTLAYSEANLVAGTLAIPAWLATRNPFFAHNMAAALGFVLSFIGAYVLVRSLTQNRGAAFFGGLAFAFCPFMYARTAHIQLMMTAGLPWSLWACHRMIANPTVTRAIVVGTIVAVQALACGYYGIFAGMAVAVTVCFYAVTRGLWRRLRHWALAATAGVVSVALVAPVFRHYLGIEGADFNRALDEAKEYSANWQAYLTSASHAHEWMMPFAIGAKDVLFPGFMVVGLTLVALALVALHRLESVVPDARPGRAPWPPRETLLLYLLLAGLAAWCSFGPDAGLYAWLYGVFPPFGFLRAPGRFGIVVTLGLVVCASLAVAHLVRPRRAWVPALLAVATAVDVAAFPLPIPEVNPRPHPVYRALANLPSGPVAEFPFFWLRSDFPRHAYYMVNSTAHWRPMVNGYSDHIPEDFRAMVTDVSGFPTRAAFRILRERRVRYVVFTLRFYDQRSRERLFERLEAYKEFVNPIIQHDDVWLYEIVQWPK
ncbi:MAG: hypothetical protein AB7I50_24510 [Vicinamibacterales bacterium]